MNRSPVTRNRLVKSILFLIISVTVANSTIRTVDQDGGSTYTSVNDALAAAVSGDTIMITGSDIDTYTDFTNESFQANVTIMGENTNPDSFPVLTFKSNDWVMWWQNNHPGTTNLSRVRLSDCRTITLGTIDRTLKINACVIENFATATAANVFYFSNPSRNRFLIITNSIFYNNSSSIFSDIQTYNGNNDFYGIVVNCTFYNNGVVNADESAQAYVNANKIISIQNSIFWENNQVSRTYEIIAKYDYCLSINNIGWGSHCIVEPTDPGFLYSTPTIPSDFSIKKTSKAINSANNTLANSFITSNLLYFDIAGNDRRTAAGYDIGAFQYVDTNVAPDTVRISARNVDENKLIGTFIGKFSAHDQNAGNVFTYKIVYGLDSSSFAISNDSLKTKAVFNYEADSIYQVKIRCFDQDSAFKDSVFTITVNNVNDTIIQLNLSDASVPEKSSTGTFVGLLSSIDGDSGSTFTYGFVNGDSSSFSIRNDSLLTKNIFDFESKHSYSVGIYSADVGVVSGDTLNRTFTIAVTNVNDSPTALSISDTLIAENVALHSIVGHFHTTDPDAGSSFTYELTSGGGSTDNASFSIIDSTLYIETSVNYELKNTFSIKVKSTDNGTPSSSIEKIFSIHVTNMNESPTEITLSSNSIEDSTTSGTFVGRLTATDPDQGESFTFSLSGNADDSLFAISGDTLKTKRLLAYTIKPEYSITVKVTDHSSLTFQKNFKVYIEGKPYILTEPSDKIAAQGDTVRLSINVIGEKPLTFAWQNSKAEEIGSDSIVVIPNVTKSLSGQYTCVITNSKGSVTSRITKLTVIQKPSITSQPISDTVIAGTRVNLFAHTTGDSLKYVWVKNNADTVGTDSLLTFDSIKNADEGSYVCVVSNVVGTATSSVALIKVINPPVFLTQPKDTTATDGDSAFFTASVDGTPPISYKWLRNGTDSIGSLQLLIIKKVAMSDDSSFYVCVIKNSAGSKTSDKAYLRVAAKPPKILLQPKDTSAQEGGTAIFRIQVEGSEPLKYTWYKSGAPQSLSSDSTVVILQGLKASDDSTTYYCEIENKGGSVISRSAVLRIGSTTPKITTQPDSIISYVSQNVSFSISASGTTPLHYTWYKSGNSTKIGSDSSTLSLTNITTGDAGKYFCIVNNGVGKDTSELFTLIVRDQKEKPVIVKDPVSQTKYFNESVTFTIAAYGNPEPKYQWVINGTKVSGKTSSSLTINNLNSTNNNSKIYCIVSNEVDTIHSDTVTLTVIPPPVAAFTATFEAGLIPLKVKFNNQSTQIINSYYWDFGDGSSSTVKEPEHTYDSEGLYSVKLVVKGPSGQDSLTKTGFILAISPGGNPVRLSYKYLSGTDAILKFANIALIDTSFDSLELWTLKGAIPTQTTGATKLITYNLDGIKLQSGIFIDTVKIPGVSGDTYGIMTYLTRKSGTRTSANNANGALVVLKDTTPPSNLLTIAGTHLGADSSFFTIGNISSIDTVKSDSIMLCFGLDTTSADFEKTSIWFSIAAIKKGNVNVFEKVIHNDLFTVGSRKIWCAVIIKSKSGAKSIRKISSFVTQASTVVNPIKIITDAISSSTIRVSWQPFSDTLITKIRIWTSESEIRPGNSVSDVYDTVTLPANKTSYIIEKLSAATQYYFGIQVFKNGMWSSISSAAISIETTLKDNETPILLNTISLKKPLFDTLSAKFTLSWCLDSSIASEQYVGITYSTTEIPKTPVSIQTIKVSSSCANAEIELHESIKFNTKYYFALWVSSNEAGPWTDPVRSSVDSFTTPVFTRELISYFDPLKTHDTVKAFNGSVVLFTDRNFDVTSKDTIVAYRNSSLKGVVTVGTGFYFAKKEQSPAFNIGLTYDSIPAGYNEDNIKLYRIKGDEIYAEYEAIQDKKAKMIYVNTRDLDNPFILLIDTITPTITVKSKTNVVVTTSSDIYDTVYVKDNISNIRWTYLTGKGDTVATASDSGYAGKTEQNVFLKLLQSSNKISTQTGLRAYFRLSDGNNNSIADLSRQVRCKEIKFKAQAKSWTPNAANKIMDTLNPEALIEKFPTTDSSEFYDTRYLRMYTWDKNKNSMSKEWIEYSDSTSSFFRFTPGNTVWIKALTDFSFNMGDGITLSLKDTQTIDLEPREYTDISLPYAFDIRFSDIANATGPGMKDSLFVYSWDADSTGKNYTARSFYIPNKTTNKDTMLCYNNDNNQLFYSIGNATTHLVKLRIPPVPVAMSTSDGFKKSKVTKWSVKIECTAKKPTIYSELYCGYSGGANDFYYLPPPSFQKSRVTIFNRTTKKSYGHFMSGEFKDGIAQELQFDNKGTEPLTYTFNLKKDGVLPDGVNASVFDSRIGKWVESGEVTVSPNSSEYRWVVASNADFRQQFQNKIIMSRYMLHSVYPNPVRNSAHIRYSVPYGANGKLHFTIYDFLGRVVWEHNLSSSTLSADQHTIVWNGVDKKGNRINSGMYLVRLSVTDNDGKILNTFSTRLTCLH